MVSEIVFICSLKFLICLEVYWLQLSVLQNLGMSKGVICFKKLEVCKSRGYFVCYDAMSLNSTTVSNTFCTLFNLSFLSRTVIYSTSYSLCLHSVFLSQIHKFRYVTNVFMQRFVWTLKDFGVCSTFTGFFLPFLAFFLFIENIMPV